MVKIAILINAPTNWLHSKINFKTICYCKCFTLINYILHRCIVANEGFIFCFNEKSRFYSQHSLAAFIGNEFHVRSHHDKTITDKRDWIYPTQVKVNIHEISICYGVRSPWIRMVGIW